MNQYFTFLWPWALGTLLSIPFLIWWYVSLRNRHVQAAAALGPLGLVQNQSGQQPGRRHHVPPALFLLALSLLLVAMARPQAMVRLPRIQGTVLMAFDVSRSMVAADLEPTRIEAAKEVAQTFVEQQPQNIQIGVVAFGNGGLIVQEPTHDRAATLSSIERLSAEGGTSIGQGIFVALNAIAGEQIAIGEEAIDSESGAIDTARLQLDDYSSAVILLLTDGENTGGPDPLEITQVAAEAGVRIYTIGIGTAEGARIEVDGFTLATQLDAALLQEIALVSNGSYFHAPDRTTLQEIYDSIDLQLTVEGEMTEVTAIFTGASLLFLLGGAFLSMLWFGRAP